MNRCRSNYLQCLTILFVLCFVKLGCFAQILDLEEGDVCRKGDASSFDYICRRIDDCTIVGEGIQKQIKPQMCSFIGSIPIVCCPPSTSRPMNPRTPPSSNHPTSPPPNPTPNPTRRPGSVDAVTKGLPSKAAYSAAEMCHKYSELIYVETTVPTLGLKKKTQKMRNCVDVKTLIVGGDKAKPKEFPHMVVLSYNEKPIYDHKRCGGSLISKRWVLTAAHCEKSGLSNFATWARVGELNFKTKFNNDAPKDYKIDQRIIHPNYNQSSHYNDIALFHLKQDVRFSPYVRPLCLNTKQSLNPTKLLASGWGKASFSEGVSSDLLKVVINHIPIDLCKSLYINDRKLPSGIDDSSMICAGHIDGGKDTCGGDSGGPLQISNPDYPCMYLQVGLTSFGSFWCGSMNTAGVYTRISNYISWIEPIVWPKDE